MKETDDGGAPVDDDEIVPLLGENEMEEGAHKDGDDVADAHAKEGKGKGDVKDGAEDRVAWDEIASVEKEV